MSMQDTGARRAALSDNKRALLEARLRGAAPAAAARPEGVTRCAGPGPEFPASFAQERMWFLSRFAPESPMYNIPNGILVPADVDVPALERALGEVVRRHETLRTTYRMGEDGQLVQVVQPAAPVRIEVIDVRDRIGPDFAADVRAAVAEEAARVFDLERAPMIRVALLHVSDADHAMVVTTHHVATDGWSGAIFYGDLFQAYEAFHAGREPSLPALPLRYADYAVWQRARLQGEALEAQVRYWRDLLRSAPTLELPADRPRPAAPTGAGRTHAFRLDAELSRRLRELARREGATLNMVLLAGFAAVLGRWSGQDDLVVGTVLGGRSRPELEGIVGMFVNSAALRLRLPAGTTFRDAVAAARRAVLEADRHQDLPFEKLVDELGVPRDLSRHPLFQVSYFHTGMAGGQGREMESSLRMRRIDDGDPGLVDTGAAQFDLGLTTLDDGDRIAGVFTYTTDLFDAETLQRLERHLATLLDAAAADPHAPLSRLPLLSGGERAALVAQAAGPALPAADLAAHRRFEEQAARTPDALAVEGEDGALTYAELNVRANRLAHHLVAMGVGPDARVGVCVEPGVGMMAAVLGALKAGGGYVPLDPAYPEDRLAYMLADSEPAVLLTQSSLRARFDGAGIPVLSLDTDAGLWADRPETPPAIPYSLFPIPSSLAYVIYTSGSTGRPKGVRVEHGALSATLAAADRAFGIGPADRAASLASFAFDIWLFEALLPLLAGGRVRFFTRERVLDVPRLAGELAGCTVLHAVPALMRGIVQAVRAMPGGVLPGLRRAFVGGDAVAPDLLEEMRAAFPAAEIHVLYGPTEAAIICAAHRLGDETATRRMVGRPLGNATLHVLEPGGSVAPTGVPGELCLGGTSVARDYLGRPRLTAERFVPDPFAAGPGARLYRTGDRVRRLPSGELEFLGRTDNQVKVRGFRIEPGEVEHALLSHPAVVEAVVVAREDAPGDLRLVGYVVPAAGAEVSPAELRAHLRDGLPEYMVPSAFVAMDALPLTPSGKVDRRALPAPDGAEAQAEYTAPRTQTEQVLAATWSELLGVERVGVTDGFFELGGHSLMAARLGSAVRDRLSVEVPVRAIFEHPTLEGFAAEVDRLLRASDGIEIPPIVRVARDGPVPLSFAQQRLWFIDRLDPGGLAYAMPFPLRLRGALDVPSLERAIGEIVRRHDALRTRFPIVDGSPVQWIEPAGEFHLAVDHLTTLTTIAAREEESARRVGGWLATPFDLEHGPLFRVRLIRIAEDDHVLLGAMHHIVSDGWSMGVFWRELVTLYHAYGAGQPSPLPELPIQYADFTVWQREWLSGERLERQVAWWREHLAGAPALLELPTDRPRPALQSYRGGIHRFVIPAEVAEPVRALARREGATPFMAFLAAFDVLMARWSGQDDVVVGTPVAGRARRETEGLIGLFINTLPIRTSLSGDPAFAELLGRVREAALGAFAHQDVPFERLVEELQPERGLSHAPVYQVMLILQNAPSGPAEGFGEELRLEEASGADGGSAKVDLTVNLVDAEDGSLAAIVEYAADLFEPATLQRLGRQLEALLAAAASDPDASISSLGMMDDAERAAVLAMGTGAEARYEDDTLPALFARQAARTPTSVALSFEGRTMTYAELDARTNQLAHCLRRLGVGPEARVGVCMERGMEMVLSLLAVLKAGGAYVPLDPEYPAERLAYMLADAAVPVLLTQPHLLDAIPAHDAQTIAIDPAFAVIDSEPREAPEHDAHETQAIPYSLFPIPSPDALAYVIYTSGSTGNPKGAMNAHRGVVNRLRWMQDEYTLSADDVVLQKTPFSFDVSVWEFFWPLITGARLVLARPGGHRDATYLAELIEHEGVTTLHFVPSMLAAFVDAAPAERCHTLSRVICSGEALPEELVQRFYARMDAAGNDRVRLHNLYGPTEAAVDVTYWPCEPDAEGPIPIGLPVANTRILVLDGRGKPTPVDVPGELHIGGVQVGRGYLGRPALTAEKFVPDPFGEPGARMYRTGDRARWTESTNALTHSRTNALQFLGRMDFQVKLRGFRIELGEIESLLVRHPSVSAAAAVVRDDGTGPRLVAYVAPREGAAPPASAELRAHLQQALPEHMVPSAIVVLDALPLTGSGKVDRRALPAPEDQAAGDELVAPRDVVEDMVAEIWAEVLQREPIGVTQNFFALGGHSLLATQVTVRIAEAFNVQVPITTFFQHPTVAGLAAAIEEIGSPVLEAMVDELAGLSAEEIEALLAEESA